MEGSTKEIHLMKILKASLFKELVELDLAGVAFAVVAFVVVGGAASVVAGALVAPSSPDVLHPARAPSDTRIAPAARDLTIIGGLSFRTGARLYPPGAARRRPSPYPRLRLAERIMRLFITAYQTSLRAMVAPDSSRTVPLSDS